MRALCENPPKAYCAPLLMRDIDGVHRAIFGHGIDYSAEKAMFNSAVLKMEEGLYGAIISSPDPLCSAIKYAAAANYIDFAKLSDLNEGSIKKVEERPQKQFPTKKLSRSSKSACRVLARCSSCTTTAARWCSIKF